MFFSVGLVLSLGLDLLILSELVGFSVDILLFVPDSLSIFVLIFLSEFVPDSLLIVVPASIVEFVFDSLPMEVPVLREALSVEILGLISLSLILLFGLFVALPDAIAALSYLSPKLGLTLPLGFVFEFEPEVLLPPFPAPMAVLGPYVCDLLLSRLL